jgi:hypothetical protein
MCSFTVISVKNNLGGESVRHFAKYILKIEYSVENSLFLEEKIAPKKLENNLKVHQKSPQIKCQNKHERKGGA